MVLLALPVEGHQVRWSLAAARAVRGLFRKWLFQRALVLLTPPLALALARVHPVSDLP
jgi:hypothetical protein